MSADEPASAEQGEAARADSDMAAPDGDLPTEAQQTGTARQTRRARLRRRARKLASEQQRPGSVSDTAPVVGGPALASRFSRSAALFGGITLLMAGHGLQNTLLGVRAESEGFSSTVAGLVMAMNFAGFLVGSALAPRLLRQVGHVRVFAALASLGSSVTLVQAVFVTPLAWGACRLVWGMCLAGLVVVAETWLNELATNRNRGQMIGIYMVVTMGSIATGQFLVTTADVNGFTLFAVSSVLVSLALVPMSLSASASPRMVAPEPLSLRAMLRTAPTGVIVAFLVGGALGSISGLGAVYAANRGLTPFQVALFVGAPMIGSLFGQIPLGRLSDRVPRRLVILLAALAAAAGCLVMLALDERTAAGIGVMALMGAFAYPIYSLAVAQANDWLRDEQRASASAVLVRMNGVGALIGPSVAALAMSVTLNAFYFVMMTAHVLIALLVTARIVFVAGPSVDAQGNFLPIPARASASVSVLLRRRR